MAKNQQIFETIVTLNAQKAKDEVKILNDKLSDLKQKKDDLLKSGNYEPTDLKAINREIKQASSELKTYKGQVMDTIDVLSDLDHASLGELQNSVKNLKKQMKGITDADEYRQMYDLLQKANVRISELRGSVDEYNREINETIKNQRQIAEENKIIDNTLDHISSSNLKDLEFSLKKVKEQLRGTDEGTEEFEKLTAKARKLDGEIKKINSSLQTSSKSRNVFVKGFDMLNKNWGAFTQIWAAVTGLSDTVRQCTKAFADMDQEMVNVQKYTGQTKQQVVEMNEDFKKMDTRTSREQLNELAGAAGRLGISSKSSIEEFVDAADKINVALGDDLGDGAVDKIGKLAQVFGEDKTKGLRGAMLATGSAINELAQSSSANAGYIVDFTADLAGIAKQAGMSQQQIMGIGSALDQNMQEEKTSATVFSQLITKMFQDPAKFANIAGIEVKKFTNLLKTDANGALIDFLQSMQNKGGFAQLAPMFESMNLDGTRAVGVLSSVATHLDQVRKAQAEANTAYSQGTSVLDEFKTQNSSVQAEMDMAKKQFKEVAIALGQQLMPVAKYTISTGSVMIKTLSTLITFTTSHIRTLALLSVSIGIVTAVYYAATIKAKALAAWEAILQARHKAGVIISRMYAAAIGALRVVYYVLTGQIQKAVVAMRAMRMAAVTNPYTALAAVIIALGVGIYKLVDAIVAHNKAVHDNLVTVRQAKEAAHDMNEASKEVNENTAEEKNRIERLNKIINSNVYSYNERKNAMIAMEKIVPGYHRNLRNEANLTAANNRALKEYVERLNDAAMAQALYNRMVQLRGKEYDLQKEIEAHNYSAKAVQAEINRHPDKYNATTYQVYTTGYGSAMIGNAIPTEDNYKKHKELQHWVDLSKKAGDNLKVVEYRIKSINDYMDAHKGVRAAYDKLIEKGGDGSSIPVYKPGTSGGSGSAYIDPKKVAKEQKAAQTARKKAKAAAEKHEREMKAARRKAYEEEIKEAKGKTDQEQAQNILAYSQGKKSYTDFMNAQHDIAVNGYKALETIYKKYGTDYGQWQDEIAKEEQQKTEDHQKALLSDIAMRKDEEGNQANKDFYNPQSEIYRNEEALNERLFEIDMSAQADKIAALQEGTQEWMDAKAELNKKEEDRELYLQQHYAEMLSQYREQWGRKDVKEQEQIAINGLKTLHEKALISEEEYQEMLKAIRLNYAKEESENDLKNSKNERFKQNASDIYTTASNEAKAEWSNDHETGPKIGSFLSQDVTIYASTLANIKKMEKEGVITHQEAMAAMSQATAEMCNGIAAKMQAAYDAVSPIMDAMSSYYSAQSDYEVTTTEKKYEKLISAAGNNTAKTKKLEEKKEKEVAKIKTKYARKQVKMQIAQAIAQTAMSAISAYQSALYGMPYPANMVLAPIAAGIALAAGAIQIATIKKQQQAQEAGYYEGGFTGGNRYRREAGVVHEGEFVANHNAVNNPQLLPALRLIDMAQRNNTVGSLTAADVSRSMGVGSATVVSAPTVNVQTDNSEMTATMEKTRDTIERLGSLLDDGIKANVSMEEFKRQERHWNHIQNNK